MSAAHAQQFLRAHHRAVLATLRADGRPQMSPVVCAVDDPSDPAWAALDTVARQYPRAIRIVLSATASSEVFERAGRAQAQEPAVHRLKTPVNIAAALR